MNEETPKLAVDCIVMVPGGIVFIERRWPPLGYAIPGGFVDVGETLEHAAIREMKEELNLDVEIVGQLGIYDDPKRDPRRHVVSMVFVGKAASQPVAGDDAQKVHVIRVKPFDTAEKLGLTLAFDHTKIFNHFTASNLCSHFLRFQETFEEKKKHLEQMKTLMAKSGGTAKLHDPDCSCEGCTDWGPLF